MKRFKTIMIIIRVILLVRVGLIKLWMVPCQDSIQWGDRGGGEKLPPKMFSFPPQKAFVPHSNS